MQIEPPAISILGTGELDFFRHYISSTSASLSDSPIIQALWRNEVTKEALPYDFLLHAIVSLSAAHMAQLNPERRSHHAQVGLHHQEVAFRRSIPVLRQITLENCRALFAFASIMAVATFTLAGSLAPEIISPIDNILTLFSLIRGVNTVLHSSFAWIRNGSLKPLLQEDRIYWRQWIGSLSGSLHLPFQQLRQLIEDEAGQHGKIFMDTADKLETLFCAYNMIANDRTMVFIWYAIVHDNYVEQVRRRHPVALVILAHYAVLLHGVKGQWWAADRGKRLVESIYSEVDEPYWQALSWPLEAVQNDWSP